MAAENTASLFLMHKVETLPETRARFRQIDKELPHRHHDALEFASGEVILLTSILPGQRVTVLQLPAAPRNEAEAKDQERLAVTA